MGEALRLLVVDCETATVRESRRDCVGRTSGESYIRTLERLAPDCVCDRVTPSDGEPAPPRAELAGYDAVFLSGSSLHLYDDTPETRRLVAFMRAVFASGTPAFGSCAGLQVATVAAGGTVRPNPNGAEAPFAHRITLTEAGRSHPMLAGRPATFDALTIHSDDVAELPEGALLLAGNGVTAVQAAEIRLDGGVFWGVQYHPELPPGEIAVAVRRAADELTEQGAAKSPEALRAQAAMLDAIDGRSDGDGADSSGLDEQVADQELRQVELKNFLAGLARPRRAAARRPDLLASSAD